MKLLNGVFWNLVDFEDLVMVYFDCIGYGRVDVRDVVHDSVIFGSKQSVNQIDLGAAVDSFYTELENHIAYFFGNNQSNLAFSQIRGNVLVLELKEHDGHFDTQLPGRHYLRYA